MNVRRLFLSVLIAGLFSSLPAAPGAQSAPEAPPQVTIAYQPGIGYANLIVLKEQGTLEKQFPHTTFDWRVLTNGEVIRTGIIAGQIQFGAGGIGPFLVGWDKIPGFRLVTSLNEMDLWLVATDPKIKTLKDFTPNMKIGMPGFDSIQAVVLRKASQEQLGNPHALDANILSIAHPLGLQSLLHGELAAHLSSPPFEFEEAADGGHIVLHSFDLFGKSTFNSVFTTQSLYDRYPKLVDAFYRDVVEATKFIEQNPKQAAEMLSKNAGGKVPAADFQRWMTHQGVTYVTTPHGFMEYAKFMRQIGMISKVPASMQELELPTLHGAGD